MNNPYINATAQASTNLANLQLQRTSGTSNALKAIGEGMKDFVRVQRENELFPLQKQTLQNQVDMGAKQLGWFDRIQNANLNLRNAQASNIKATTGHTNAITAGTLLNNRFNKATLNNNIVAQNTKNQAIVAKNLLDATAFSDIANSTYASDPSRQREYFDYVENYTNPRGTQLSDMDRMYYELLEQGKIPLDNDTLKPQSRAVWLLDQKNGRGKLNITQTNQLYQQIANANTTLDQIFQEMTNYDPNQYGVYDSWIRKFDTPKHFSTGMQNADTHELRLRGFIKDLVDKGVLTNQEQKQALSLVSGSTEEAVANNRKALIDMFIRGLENKIENFELRGSISDEKTIPALKDKLNQYKSYRSQLDDWDGSTEVVFKDAPYRSVNFKPVVSVKDYLNQNKPTPSASQPIMAKPFTPQPRSNLANQPNTQESTKPKIDLSQFLKTE